MNITQKNIAEAAQVSQALVSLILSERAGGGSPQNPLRVSPETRQKVLETAERLGYRGKAPSRSDTGENTLSYLGCLPPDEVAGVCDWRRAVDQSQSLLTQNALLEATSRQGLSLQMRLLAPGSDLHSAWRSEGVGGVFLGAAIPGLREHLGPKVPIIAVGGRFLPEGDVVLANEQEVVEQAVEFLNLNGHTRIAFLTTGTEPDVAARRRVAFAEAADELGMEPWDGDVHDLNVAQILDRILDPQQSTEARPTAVIAEESLALALQTEAVRRGCTLPEELSLLGLGGSSASVLTTAGVCPGEMAHAAAMLMNERRQNPSDLVGAHRKIEIAPTVTDRGSVARRTSLPLDRPSVSEIFPQKTPSRMFCPAFNLPYHDEKDPPLTRRLGAHHSFGPGHQRSLDWHH